MNKHERHKDDWKLLLTIGFFVVAGVAGIAILAGIGASREASGPESGAAAPMAPSAHETRAPGLSGLARASGSDTDAAVGFEGDSKIPGSMIGPNVGVHLDAGSREATGAAFAIDPNADLAAVGQAAFASREFEKAVAYWRADAEQRPERSYSRYMLGLSLWKAGKLEDAEGALRKAAELNPDSVRARINLSRVLNQKGEYEAALEAAEQARRIDGEHPQALYLQARSLFNLERFDDSKVAVEQALAFDPDYGHAYNLLGLIGIRCSRYTEAAESLASAARLEPDLAFFQANHGRALELAGRYDEAARAFTAALAIDPEDGDSKAGLVRIGDMKLEPVSAEGESQESVTAIANVAPSQASLASDVGGDDAPEN